MYTTDFCFQKALPSCSCLNLTYKNPRSTMSIWVISPFQLECAETSEPWACGSWSLNLGLSCCCSVDWTILVELCLLHLGLASWMHPPLLYQKQTSETLALQGWQLHQFSTSAPCVPPSCTLLLLSKSALLPSLAGNLETVFCRYCSNSKKLETLCLWMGGMGS